MTGPVYSWHDLVAVTCYKCAVVFGMPNRLDEECRRTKQTFWCPAGHQQVYAESTEDKLRREMNVLKQREAMHIDEANRLRRARDAADAARAESERKAARVAKRISRGVCPGCNRTFANVARHMTSKHFECAAVVSSERKAPTAPARRLSAKEANVA